MGIKGVVTPGMEWQVYNPFRQNGAQQPFLSPLGRQRRSLPSIAMPLTVIIIGGIALVIASSILFSGIAIKADTADIAIAATSAIEDQADAPQVLAQEALPSHTAALPPVASPASPEPAAIEEEPQILSFNAPMAGNDAEIAVLEVIQMPPVEEEEPAPAVIPERRPDIPQAVAQAPSSPKPASAGQKNAVTNRAVNMRAAPDKNAPVLLVVPANTQIETQANCSWCAITYQGNQGYIYKSFIDYR